MMTTFRRSAPSIQTTPRRQPSKQAKQRVRDAFDGDKLAHICTTWDFHDYGERVELLPASNGRERFYYYKDNGADVLAIAHLDSVQEDGTCSIMDTSAGLIVVSGTLDDRLGAYTILELLPALGVTCDWLLTTDEELGRSTADEFITHKTYNWMFQFDRGGTDVVMYHYETPNLVDLVEASGARVGMGSFSDICMLDHLGCAGFNWGVGYRDYHGPKSHAWLEDTFRMVARFVKFYNANATTALVHDDDARYTDDGDVLTAHVVVDCGHEVDLYDPTSYVESFGGAVIDCIDCGSIPGVQTA